MPEQLQPTPDPMTLPPKTKGKGLVVAIVVVIVLAIAAVAGTWYFMNKQLNEQKAQSQQQIDELNKQVQDLQKQAESKTSSTSTDTRSITNSQFVINIPNAWFYENCNTSDPVVITLFATTKNDLGTCNSDNLNQMSLASSKDATKIAKPTGNSTQVQINGTSAQRYETTNQSTGNSPETISKKSIEYYFQKNGITYGASYVQVGNMPDVSAEFDKIIQSGTFK